MSLGNDGDTDFRIHAVFKEAAEQIVLNGLSEDQAISAAKDRVYRQEEAERLGQGIRDEQGGITEYSDESLNSPAISAEDQAEIHKSYAALCERNGLDSQ